MIYWSTDAGDGKRAYYALTSDFTTFSKAAKFFDPGYTEIDGCLLKVADQNYYFFFKDERTTSKRIYCIHGSTPQGTWSDVPVASITNSGNQGVEGPSAIKIGNEYRLYFDPYSTRQNYRMIKSTDLVTWTDGGTIKKSSDSLNFYYSHCHVTEIPKNIYDWITTNKLSVRRDGRSFAPKYVSGSCLEAPGIYNILGKKCSSIYSWSRENAIPNLPAGYLITVDKNKKVGNTVQITK
jgi:hypothetical protein